MVAEYYVFGSTIPTWELDLQLCTIYAKIIVMDCNQIWKDLITSFVATEVFILISESSKALSRTHNS